MISRFLLNWCIIFVFCIVQSLICMGSDDGLESDHIEIKIGKVAGGLVIPVNKAPIIINGGSLATETDERDSLSSFAEMEHSLRVAHEVNMTGLYDKALAGDSNDLRLSAQEGDPFAQVYWSYFVLQDHSNDKSKAISYLARCRKLFNVGRKVNGRSAVFSRFCGFIAEKLRIPSDILPYSYIESADKFDDTQSKLDLANLLYERREYKSSLEYYNMLIEQGNEVALQRLRDIANRNEDIAADVFRLSLALYCEKKNTSDEALHFYKICARKPFQECSAKAFYRLAKIYEGQNRLKEASKNYYDAIAGLYPVVTVFDIHSATNQTILDDINRLCAARNGYALFYRGRIYDELSPSSGLEMALGFYEQAGATTEKPESAELAYYTARVYRKLGQFAEATELYFNIALVGDQRALNAIDELCRDSNGFAQFYRARLHEQRAQSFENSGDLKSANIYLGEALGLFYKAALNEPSKVAESTDKQMRLTVHKDGILAKLNVQNGRKKSLENRFDKDMNSGVSTTTEMSAVEHYA